MARALFRGSPIHSKITRGTPVGEVARRLYDGCIRDSFTDGNVAAPVWLVPRCLACIMMLCTHGRCHRHTNAIHQIALLCHHTALLCKVKSTGGHYRHSKHTNICHGKELAQDAVEFIQRQHQVAIQIFLDHQLIRKFRTKVMCNRHHWFVP